MLRNYQDVAKAVGGEVLFACKGEECGGDSQRSSDGGGGKMSLTMYFFYASQLKDADFSNGKCALPRRCQAAARRRCRHAGARGLERCRRRSRQNRRVEVVKLN